MMRLSRIALSVLALIALVAIVAGIPAALVAFVGWPIPDPIPTGAELGDMVAGRMPVPADLIISILAAVMWLLWAQVAWATLVEVVAASRGRLARRAPVVPGVQATVGKLVTTVTLLTTALAARPVAAGPLLPVAAVIENDGTIIDTGGSSNGNGTQEVNGVVSSAGATGPSLVPYMTEPGDTWWGIAESTFGSGTRWKEIRNLNLGRAMEDGTVISTGTDLLRPDWRLLLPAPSGAVEFVPTTSTATAVAAGEVREVVVESGDTLWDLAEDDLADEGREPSVSNVVERVGEIADLNRAVLNGDPDLIFPGQRLELPARPALAERAPAAASTGAEAEPGPDTGNDPVAGDADPVAGDADPVAGDADASSEGASQPMAELEHEPVLDPNDGADEDDGPGDTQDVDIRVDGDPAPDEARPPAEELGAAPSSPLSPVGEIGGTQSVASSPGATTVPVEVERSLVVGVSATSPEYRPLDRPASTARFLPNPIPSTLDSPGLAVPANDVGTDRSSGNLPGSLADDLSTRATVGDRALGPVGQVPGEADLDTATSRAPIFVGLAAITLIGGYLHRAFKRRRKTALQHRHPGRMPSQPKQRRTRTLARRLAAAAEPEHPEFLNLGLRALGRLLQDTPTSELPRISGAWISHNRLVLALADDSPRRPPPAPFVPFADGSGWSLQRSHFDEIRAIARGANGPLPLLTTIGTTTALDLALTTNSRAPADAYGLASSLLFAVDLEVGRVISVQGPRPGDVIETLSMMVLELATSETADQAEIVCVGFGRQLETFERVTWVDDLSPIIEELEEIAHRADHAAGDASPFATRVGNGAADTWNPVIVFHADPHDPEARALTELAEQTEGGVTAVCGYPTATGWTFLVDGDEIRCPDLPDSLGQHKFTRARPGDVESIAELFDERWDSVELDDEFWQPIDPDEFDLGLIGDESPTPPVPATVGAGEAASDAPPGTGSASPAGAGAGSAESASASASASAGSTSAGLRPLRHSVEHRPDQVGGDDPAPARPSGDRHLYMVTPSPVRTPPGQTETPVVTRIDEPAPGEPAPEEPAVDELGAEDPAAGGPARDEPEAGPALRVNVLGHYTIGGFHVGDRVKPWKYSKTAELILYLLLHPQGASQDLLMEQLFPEQPPNRPRLNQLVSDARTKALGVDDDGEYHLPHASPSDPFYRLAPTVSFDLRDFAHHCARARKAGSPQAQAAEWTAALELVQGRPFTLPHDGYGWAMPEIEATAVKVEEAASNLADIATELGDHDLAVWATKKGLLTGTGYYELLVKRGRSALLAENPEEIVRAFADLQMSLDYTGAPEEGMPDLSHHPELEGVYNDLSDERGRDRTP